MTSKISNNLELLSIHIPKTAGTSFYKALESVYGRDALLRLDFSIGKKQGLPAMIATNNTDQSLLDKIASEGKLDRGIRVVHGHFRYEHFAYMFEMEPNTRVISWVRDPIERIVSSYNYRHSILEKEAGRTSRAQRLGNSPMRDLMQWANEPGNFRAYTNYLRGRELADYDFLGIMEHYEEELRRLARILDMPALPNLKLNSTSMKSYLPSSQERAKIAELCKESIGIYRQALDLKTG